MQCLTYKVNPKHRVSKATKDASIWTVDQWTEIQLFAIAGKNHWSENANILWAVDKPFSKLGEDTEYDLYIAKYTCDHNSEWHGYPVCPKQNDIPPNKILDFWFKEGLIDKRDRNLIQQGKFKK